MSRPFRRVSIRCALVVLAVAGCKSKTNADFDRATREACTADDECRVAYGVMGKCCATSCDPVGAYNDDFSSMVSEWKRDHCSGADCPHVLCPDPEFDFAAVCEAGFCALRKTSVGAPED